MLKGLLCFLANCENASYLYIVQCHKPRYHYVVPENDLKRVIWTNYTISCEIAFFFRKRKRFFKDLIFVSSFKFNPEILFIYQRAEKNKPKKVVEIGRDKRYRNIKEVYILCMTGVHCTAVRGGGDWQREREENGKAILACLFFPLTNRFNI